MLLLALDTSTRQSSIALCSDDECYAEHSWSSTNNHSVELLERIQRIMADSHCSMAQLDAVAVATGPGSFNGVRVAVATAKALAFALKKPLIGISTLEIIATQPQHSQQPVCALLEAGRSELYAACYRFEELRSGEAERTLQSHQLGEYLLAAPAQLAIALRELLVAAPGEKLLFCGEISVASRQALRQEFPEQSLFIGNVQAARRASVLAVLALQRLHEGRVDDPLMLEPLYLRRPSITTSTRKQPLLGTQTLRPATGPHTTEREEGALRH